MEYKTKERNEQTKQPKTNKLIAADNRLMVTSEEKGWGGGEIGEWG